MTSTLVENIPAPPPAPFDPHIFPKHPQSHSRPPVQSKVGIEPWVTQLAHLASEHHLSEYNRIKYGHSGCPVPYAPLSLNAPEIFDDLRIQQATATGAVLWLPCPEVPAVVQVAHAPERGDALVGGSPSLSLGSLLQQELSTALEDSLPSQISPAPIPEGASTPSTPIKTSRTHPLNISTIIPSELLSALSSHVSVNIQPSPVILHMPDSYTLHHITGYTQLIPSMNPTSMAAARKVHSHLSRRTLLSAPIPIRSSQSAPVPPHPPKMSPNQSNIFITEALRAAIDAHLTPGPPMLNKLSSSPPLTTRPSLPPIITQPTRVHPSSDNSVGDSCISSPQLLKSGHGDTSAPPRPLIPSVLDLLHEQPAISVIGRSSQNPHRLRAAGALLRPASTNRNVKSTFKLGNLLLSSCPGKKVRLTGPVRGRGAICRDLETDLRRIREVAGARCIVCCLGDEELEFLGISWSEYVSSAHRIGMDVLRIPLPEGLAPISPESLDEPLTKIITNYTMRGLNILVHCRGGLGRAGLVACCWALKLGLCGWIHADEGAIEEGSQSQGQVRRDTLQLIERAIAVMRRRRSVKAIETLEQVRFLADYVDYLRK